MVQLAANVSNDSLNSGVDWTLSCGSSGAGACGTISPTHTGSSNPTAFKAPSAIPTGGTVTITATSTTDNAHLATTVITINPITANGLLDGQFAFLISGRNSEGAAGDFYAMAGSFVGDGSGNIVAGQAEVADFNNGKSTSLSGTYTMGADGRGQITLNTTGLSGFGVSGTITLSVAFVSPKQAVLSETDPSGTGTGVLFLQNLMDVANAASPAGIPLNGTYTLSLAGAHFDDFTKLFFLNAALTATASTNGTFMETSLVGDSSDVGVITANASPTTQPVSGGPVINAYGAVSFSGLDVGLLFPGSSLSLKAYLIDANHYILAQDSNFHFALGGYLTLQPASPQITGIYAFTEAGATSTSSPQVAGGILNCASAGVLDVTPLGGTAIANQSFTASCTAPVSGRGLITLTGSTGGISKFAAYPTMDRGVSLIELDGGAAGTSGPSGAGIALPQTIATPIAATSFSGKYAGNFLANPANAQYGLAGRVVSDGASALSGTVDVNSLDVTVSPPVATPSSNVALTGSFTVNNNGRFPLVLNIATTTPKTINPACYVVDASTCLLLGLDTTTPGVGILQLQNLGF